MTSSTDLGAVVEAFILEHDYCGELDGSVEADRVWMSCSCGAVINRRADDVARAPTEGGIMNLRLRLAFGCYLVALLILAAFGLVYLISPQFMPYHAAAIGTKWGDVAPSYRILIHSLMKAAGAGFLGSAIAGAFVLFVPFRAGAGWARWAIFIPGLIVGIPTLYASLTVKWGTPASPPWIAPLVGVILVAAGFLLSSGRARPDTRR